MGLYEAAFATLTRLYGSAARQPITGITLIAGFASTVGWPVTSWLDAHYGWRIACQVWAVVHLLLALPLNLFLPRASAAVQAQAQKPSNGATVQSETFAMVAVAYVFAATGFVSSGLSALLPTMLVQFGATPSAALFAGMLIGPSQVAARIVEAGWLARYHPLLSARLATLTNPIGVVLLAVGGPILAPAFAVFYGAGNGILTIARGTLPLAIFGPQNYGYRLGIIGAPARMAQAGAPLLFSLLIDIMGSRVLIVSSALSLAALLALFLVRSHPPVTTPSGGTPNGK
jgi:hypothetical protein